MYVLSIIFKVFSLYPKYVPYSAEKNVKRRRLKRHEKKREESNFSKGNKDGAIKHAAMRAMNWLWMYFIANESAWLTHEGKNKVSRSGWRSIRYCLSKTRERSATRAKLTVRGMLSERGRKGERGASIYNVVSFVKRRRKSVKCFPRARIARTVEMTERRNTTEIKIWCNLA